MKLRLPRNKRFEGGMLFGATNSTYDFAVWVSESAYQEMGKPTKIRVEVKNFKANAEKEETTVQHLHKVSYDK